MRDSKDHKIPLPITTEEFDRKAEAGEDIDDYLDWENVVTILPGELAPGQEPSAETTAKLEQDKAIYEDVSDQGSNTLLITLPLWALERLGRVAASDGISREYLAQLLLVQHLGQYNVPA